MTTLAEVVAGFPRPAPGARGDPGLFAPGSTVRRITAERVLLLGGGRALLMQLANPLVAAGVADHSAFDRSPWDRLWGTLDTVLSVVFGDTAQAYVAADRVASIHRTVVGERSDTPYRALDPDLLLWVHATLVDSALVSWRRFVGPLPTSARDRYYEEMKVFASVLLLPVDVLPPDFSAFERYLRDAVRGLRVTREARRLALGVLRPPAPLPLQPFVTLQRFVTVGLLPETIRAGFGLAWSPAQERSLDALTVAIRGVRPLLPTVVRRWPHAREAAERAD